LQFRRGKYLLIIEKKINGESLIPPELAKIKIELATFYEKTILPDYKILRLINAGNPGN